MSGSLRNHLRSNVIGYIALFAVLVGGTAVAAKQSRHAPRNTVVSKSIKDGQVAGRDLAKNAVVSSKIKDGTIGGEDVDPEGTLSFATHDQTWGDGSFGMNGSGVGGGFFHPAAPSIALDTGGLSLGEGIAGDEVHDATYTLDGVSLSQHGILLESAEASYGAHGMHVDDGAGQASYGAQIDLAESATPAPPPDHVQIFARDNAGVTQLVAQFADGSITVLGQEGP